MLGATMIVATLPVSDLERARAFYGETLGLTQLWENPAHRSASAAARSASCRYSDGRGS